MGKNILLYPNPAQSSIRFQFSAQQARMSIFDAVGRQVVPASVIYAGQAIDISQLPTGVYLIQLDINGKKTVKHLLKTAE
ncbi:T9SS type A sorting domain-containing protein [Chitinophaga pinensis]|nr:T9SS type A sorting domain-containing protein [Chitinophaga pinensis]